MSTFSEAQEHREYLERTAPTMQLIGIGRCAAKPAGELVVGDVITWNYGHRYEVKSIVPAGQQSIRVVERSLADGKEFTRVLRRNRLVVA